MEKIANEMFQKWNESLKTGDAEKVAELYTNDDAFLPTLSSEYKHGHNGTVDYFEHFLAKNPVGIIKEEDVRGDDNFIIHSGLYDFEVDGEREGERDIVEARFTFVYQKTKDGEWKIYHHHSSLKPQTL